MYACVTEMDRGCSGSAIRRWPVRLAVANDPPDVRLYLIAVGEAPADLMSTLAENFHERYGLSVEVLPTMQVDNSAFDGERRQFEGMKLIDHIAMQHLDLVRDRRTRIIGITPYDLYMETMRDKWAFTFGVRHNTNQVAIVSFARMDPMNLGQARDDNRLRERLRKMLTKDVGLMCLGLQLSDDPRSVLYGNILGAADLDDMTEDFEPRP
jgi:predicted Zn-dependent protease